VDTAPWIVICFALLLSLSTVMCSKSRAHTRGLQSPRLHHVERDGDRITTCMSKLERAWCQVTLHRHSNIERLLNVRSILYTSLRESYSSNRKRKCKCCYILVLIIKSIIGGGAV
jgi:hypothetical protein